MVRDEPKVEPGVEDVHPNEYFPVVTIRRFRLHVKTRGGKDVLTEDENKALAGMARKDKD